MPVLSNDYGHDISGTTAQAKANYETGEAYFDTTLGQQQVANADGDLKPIAGIFAAELTFEETAGAGTYTGTVSLPAGATLVDIIVHAGALWDNAGAVSLEIGDTDPDGFYTAVDLKATDLTAGQSLSFAQNGGVAGAYNVGTNTHWTNRYSATARDINAIVTTASTGGTAGRTRVTVIYSLPTSVVAATKVAA